MQDSNSLNEKKFYKTKEFKKKENYKFWFNYIYYSIYSVYNHKLENLLKQEDKILCYNECDNYLTGVMSLPYENIKFLKIKYNIDDPVYAVNGILGDVTYLSE